MQIIHIFCICENTQYILHVIYYQIIELNQKEMRTLFGCT